MRMKEEQIRNVAKNIDEITSCDDILLFRKITHPCYTIERGQTGNVPNGMYSVAMADRKSTRLNSSHSAKSRMPSSA